jgi:hypothetical protein
LGAFLREPLQAHRDSHLHGLAVLEKDWFISQQAFTGDTVRLRTHADHALLTFVTALLEGIQGFPMAEMCMTRYINWQENR